jgi:hypothetical protein
VLSFEEFVFLDGELNEGVQAHTSRGHRSLDTNQVEEYLQQIEVRESYAQYSAGSKPNSIPEKFWRKMLENAENKSSYSTCAGCESQDEHNSKINATNQL